MSKFINLFLFILLCLIWGSSFILMKFGLYDQNNQVVLSAYQVAALRVFTAGLTLLPFFINKVQRYPAHIWAYIMSTGLLGIFFPAFLFCIAETKLDSGIAGMLNALTPFFVILFGFFIFKGSIPRIHVVGIIIGFGGIVLLVAGADHVSFKSLSYSGFILLATVCYGLNNNIIKYKLSGVPALSIATLSFVSLIIPSGLILWFTGFFQLPLGEAVYMKSTLATAVLGVIGSAIAWIILYTLIKRSGVVFASAITFVIPVVALFWGWVYGEGITLVQVLSLMVILAGVYLTTPLFQKHKALLQKQP
jgi:drug/metabolite transporter (DMT)-like permease